MPTTVESRAVESPTVERMAGAGRRAGYVAAAVVNLVLLWITNQLLDWGWPAFLTDDFEDLLPWVNASFLATIGVNLIWVWRDPAWFRHLGEAATNLISLVVAWRTWQIFPFDFSGYSFDWELVARILIVVGMVGAAIGTVVELVRLARHPTTSG